MEEHLRQLIRGIESLRGWTELRDGLRNMKGELAKKGTQSSLYSHSYMHGMITL